jgi:Tol biopolymer transport system component
MNDKLNELAKNMARSATLPGACKKFAVAMAGIALAASSVAAQQLSAWSAPVNMGPSINTTNNERHSALSADLLTIFLASDRPGGLGGFDLWVAQRANRNADWAPGQNLGPNINTSADEYTPELSPDDHWLFFANSGPDTKNFLEIYAAFRSETNNNLGWGQPVNLGKGVNSVGHPTGDPSMFVDPQTGVVTLFFARLDRDGDDWNIYQSVQGSDGTFGDAVPVAELNTRNRETHPTVRRDGLEVIFTSNRPGSLGGLDLWVATRLTTSDTWSTPVNLGPTVNTEFDDRAPYLSDDGLTLILASNRPGGFGGDDLYVSTRKKLQ